MNVRDRVEEVKKYIEEIKKAQASEDTTPAEQKVTVFGGGCFGTALAYLVGKKGIPCCILVREQDVCRSINEEHRNCRYNSDIQLPASITASIDAEEALKGTTFIIHAVPVQFSFAFLQKVAPLISDDVPIISASKGIEVSSLRGMAEVISDAVGRPNHPIGILSGPSFAREIVEELPASVVIASRHPEVLARTRRLMHGPSFRVYKSSDVTGVEIAGALKNVLAIGAGIIAGLKCGHSAVSLYVTRGIREIRSVAVAMGADPNTVGGLSGIGDIMLTCYGPLSRNRTLGFRLGEGETIEAIMGSSNQVAEGAATARAIWRLAQKYRLVLPTLLIVDQVVRGRVKPQEAQDLMMSLPPPDSEFDDEFLNHAVELVHGPHFASLASLQQPL